MNSRKFSLIHSLLQDHYLQYVKHTHIPRLHRVSRLFAQPSKYTIDYKNKSLSCSMCFLTGKRFICRESSCFIRENDIGELSASDVRTNRIAIASRQEEASCTYLDQDQCRSLVADFQFAYNGRIYFKVSNSWKSFHTESYRNFLMIKIFQSKRKTII
jgi:hypothetical protein